MKQLLTKRKAVAITLFLGLIVAGLLYQFGPFVRTGSDRVLARCSLEDNSRLLVVAHRTKSLVDAYEVSLYRVNSNGDVTVCFLGHEEPFWWGCSLLTNNASDAIEIHALGSFVAKYSVADGNVTWSDNKRGSYPSYKIDGVKVKWPIPQVVLANE